MKSGAVKSGIGASRRNQTRLILSDKVGQHCPHLKRVQGNGKDHH